MRRPVALPSRGTSLALRGVGGNNSANMKPPVSWGEEGAGHHFCPSDPQQGVRGVQMGHFLPPLLAHPFSTLP